MEINLFRTSTGATLFKIDECNLLIEEFLAELGCNNPQRIPADIGHLHLLIQKFPQVRMTGEVFSWYTNKLKLVKDTDNVKASYRGKPEGVVPYIDLMSRFIVSTPIGIGTEQFIENHFNDWLSPIR